MDITSFVAKRRDRALLIGDYSSYRRQLSRQLLSLRRRLGRATPRREKYKAKAKITIEDVANNHEFVHYLLLQAERAWAHAMHIKSTHAEDNASKGISGPTRKHIISKLHKARGYAEQVVALLRDRHAAKATDAGFLEAEAYALCLTGSEEFEKQATKRYEDPAAQKEAWNRCLVTFSEARVIYEALLFSQKLEVFKETLTGNVDPSIRYAAYQSRISRSIPLPTVAKRHFRRDRTEVLGLVEKLNPNALQEDATQVATSEDGTQTLQIPTTITWRGRTAPIADAAIGQALAATTIAAGGLTSLFAAAASTKGGSSKARERNYGPKALAAAYDPVLTRAQDAVDAVRSSIADLQKEGLAESDSRMQDLRVSDLATNYSLISWRVGRNRVLISGASNDDGASFNPAPPRPTARKGHKKPLTLARTNGAAGSTVNGADRRPATAAATAARRSRTQQLAVLRERDVLYDATLQSLDAVVALRGAAASPAFLAETARARAYFRALKCLNVARSHAAVAGSGGTDSGVGDANALAMYQRAALVLHEGASPSDGDGDTLMDDDGGDGGAGPDATRPPTLAISSAQLASLRRAIADAATRQRGLVALRRLTAAPASPAAQQEPLAYTLHTGAFPAGGHVDTANLVSYPPRLRAVPAKPIFLDIAWNYIEYPGRRLQDGLGGAAAKAAEAAAGAAGRVAEAVQPADADGAAQQRKDMGEEQQAPKKKGWFGFGRS